MTLALIGKTTREHRATLLACLLALVAVALLITLSFRAFGKMYESMMSMMSPAMMTAFYGGSLAGVNAANGWVMAGFIHPIVFLALSSFVIAVATRSLAGEVERGTIDILLACPLARGRLVTTAAVVIMGGLLILLGGLFAGTVAGAALAGSAREVNFAALGWLTVNLFALFLAIGGYSLLFGALNSERGRATAWAAGITAAAWFINLIAELWDKLQPLRTFSVFHYYQAQPVMVSGHPAWTDLGILISLAVAAFTAALVVFRRRDIATV